MDDFRTDTFAIIDDLGKTTLVVIDDLGRDILEGTDDMGVMIFKVHLQIQSGPRYYNISNELHVMNFYCFFHAWAFSRDKLYIHLLIAQLWGGCCKSLPRSLWALFCTTSRGLVHFWSTACCGSIVFCQEVSVCFLEVDLRDVRHV